MRQFGIALFSLPIAKDRFGSLQRIGISLIGVLIALVFGIVWQAARPDSQPKR